jgi:RNA polymerase-binding transcription factor DksA
MDDMDRAQAREQLDRDSAVAAAQARIAASFAARDASGDGRCIDCDEPIDPDRLALVRCTSRCTPCAAVFERRHA